ncbi:MAG: ATP synthase F1 subunit delta [Myxococcales bacterium]|nr:ATP synthase F1 subunit delta [Myxococcales bacterium]
MSGSLARRYARAIVQIGIAQGNLDQLGADLRSFAAAMKTSAELVSSLTNPAIRRADRRRVIDALLVHFKAATASKTLISVLLDGERIGTLPMISREVDSMIEARAGRVSAEVTSATELSAAQVAQLTTVLERLSGKKIDVVKRLDPSLIGGVVAKVGDIVYDGSLRSQLHLLRDELTK